MVISEMETLKKKEERERKSENEERSNKKMSMVDKNSRPPEDDCCPICFDDFNFPCRTNCGHWFCSSCIMELWRYRASLKQCKCPICGCLILHLLLHSSLLIQPPTDHHQEEEEEDDHDDDDEKVAQILRDIQLYNTINNAGGFSSLFTKAAALPLLIRRGLWEYLNLTMLGYICNSMHRIGLLLGILYEVFEFQFFLNGGLGIAVWFDMCIYGVAIFLLWNVIWQRWTMAMRRLH